MPGKQRWVVFWELFYGVLLGFVGFYGVLLGFMMFYWVLWCFIGVLLGLTPWFGFSGDIFWGSYYLRPFGDYVLFFLGFWKANPSYYYSLF